MTRNELETVSEGTSEIPSIARSPMDRIVDAVMSDDQDELARLAMSDDRKWFGEDNTTHCRGRTGTQEETSFRESSATRNLTRPLELEGT